MMYNKIKSLLYSVFPKRFLIKNERLFRKAMYPFYIGSSHQCSVCQKKLRSFISNQRKEQLCPNCGSLPRDRRLFLEFKKEVFTTQPIKLLDISPSRSLYFQFNKSKNIDYYPSDLSDDFMSKYQYDLTDMPVEDNYFDVIICFHILEHIEKDTLAMKELYRTLKPRGLIFVQTPFKSGEIYENSAITNPEDRKVHFGQDDHVRIYSVDGLKQRLTAVGFKVDVHQYETDEYLGLVNNETILKLTK